MITDTPNKDMRTENKRFDMYWSILSHHKEVQWQNGKMARWQLPPCRLAPLPLY
jgi:hypothetical protein